MDNKTTSINKSEYTIFTVCNLAYLPKALVLAESALKFNNQKLNIYLFDRKREIDLTNIDADIYWIEDLNIPNFYQLAFKYDIIEFSTSLKPFITLYLLGKYKKVIFLDPDTCLFNNVTPILEDLEKHSIVLTPHYTTPQSDDPSESDIGMMRFGSFNLGFYAVRDSQTGISFLQWWSKRCIDHCYMESQFGLSTDQKWVTIAPCFFQDLYVSFNLGYNFAAWNSWERKLTKTEEGIYMVNNNFPLIFFHFSNFDGKDPGYLNKRSCYEKNVIRPDLTELGLEYNEALNKKKVINFLNKGYGFDYMSGGEYISPSLRRAYACVLNEFPVNHNPFDTKGEVGIFAKKNHLFEKENKSYSREGFAAISNNTIQLKIIYFLMRTLLRIVGPNKFQNLSRLLVYLSSYRQNRDLWKY